MVIAIFGESCVGKSTLANVLRDKLSATVYSGKDYLRLAKNEAEAENRFIKLLTDAIDGEHIIYVLAEPALLRWVPDEAIRVLVTADLDVIKARFAQRMNGVLPPPVAQMLEKKHGCFDSFTHDIQIRDGDNIELVCMEIMNKIGKN